MVAIYTVLYLWLTSPLEGADKTSCLFSVWELKYYREGLQFPHTTLPITPHDTHRIQGQHSSTLAVQRAAESVPCHTPHR